MTSGAHNPVLELACELIRRPSVTPDDAGCQELLGGRLARSGFSLQPLVFGDVTNLWAVRGSTGPLLVFAGHTDVVPTGAVQSWSSPPFEPTLRHGFLYGRGAADMKSSLAAMIVACERFLERYPEPAGRIGFLITSDEEGPAVDGTRRVMEHLRQQQIVIDYCVVGEPSSSVRLGDTIRVGRRGSVNAQVKIIGSQGHVAYPQLANNPVHAFAPALVALTRAHWDDGNDSFPPTTLQISNIHAGTGASNVIPGVLTVDFNLRFNTEQTADRLQHEIMTLLNNHGLDYELDWTVSGEPFLTPPGRLTTAVRQAIERVTGIDCEASTAGGTSDGRFIAPTGAQVVELGPVNATIHKIDERMAIDDLMPLCELYEAILIELLT